MACPFFVILNGTHYKLVNINFSILVISILMLKVTLWEGSG